MDNTTVAALIASGKIRYDYDITDDDLDVLLLDCINDGVILIRQWLMDAGLQSAIGKTGSFVVLAGDESADIRLSMIVGDATTFTGVAGDTIDVTIDGTAYADIDISAATTIALVVAAINSATGGTQASADDNGNLVITSTTTDGTGTVVIADGTSTVTTVVARLVSTARERTDTGISDFGEPLRVREKDNRTIISIRDWEDLVEMQPDETESTSSTPDFTALWDGDNKLFFRSALSKSLRVYIDYFADQTALVAGSTLPFKRKYDPLLKQYMRVEFFAWKFADDPRNPQMVREEAKLDSLKGFLITHASKNFGKNRQSDSRRGSDGSGPQRSTRVPEANSQ